MIDYESIEAATAFGFERYHKELALSKELTLLDELLEVMPEKDYCVVGGGAVSLIVGNHLRAVSPDLDILITADALSELVKSKRFEFRRNQFGLTAFKGSFEIDMLVSVKNWQREAIKNANSVRFKSFALRIIPSPYLMLMKILAGRDKDQEDAMLLIKTAKPTIIAETKRLFKRFALNEIEEFDSLVTLSNIQELSGK